MSGEKGSPHITPHTVEATALLLQVLVRDVDDAETTERLKRAYALGPSALANYVLATNYVRKKTMPMDRVLPYYARAYRMGDALCKVQSNIASSYGTIHSKISKSIKRL